MPRSKEEKAQIETVSQELLRLTGGFCDQHLGQEYRALAERLVAKMRRKRQVPFLRGRVEIWAAAIIYALGQINFLFDPAEEPHVSPSQITDYFGTSKSTVGQRAKRIRDMFRMAPFDAEFSTQRMLEANPFNDMVMINGLIVPMSFLPPEVQERLRSQREAPGKGDR